MKETSYERITRSKVDKTIIDKRSFGGPIDHEMIRLTFRAEMEQQFYQTPGNATPKSNNDTKNTT